MVWELVLLPATRPRSIIYNHFNLWEMKCGNKSSPKCSWKSGRTLTLFQFGVVSFNYHRLRVEVSVHAKEGECTAAVPAAWDRTHTCLCNGMSQVISLSLLMLKRMWAQLKDSGSSVRTHTHTHTLHLFWLYLQRARTSEKEHCDLLFQRPK